MLVAVFGVAPLTAAMFGGLMLLGADVGEAMLITAGWQASYLAVLWTLRDA